QPCENRPHHSSIPKGNCYIPATFSTAFPRFLAGFAAVRVGKDVDNSFHGMRTLTAALIVVAVVGSPLMAQQPPAQQRPVFRSGVTRVSVAATVRDGHGRPVTN